MIPVLLLAIKTKHLLIISRENVDKSINQPYIEQREQRGKEYAGDLVDFLGRVGTAGRRPRGQTDTVGSAKGYGN